MPEGFSRFGMPGVWFLSCGPPAVMGSRLPVGGFLPQKPGLSESVGSLTIPGGRENICFTRSISPSSHLNLLFSALLVFFFFF